MSSAELPPRVLLDLRFRALAPVNRLPHFHGPLWSALLRRLLRDRLPKGGAARAGVWLESVESGAPPYQVGDKLHLGLSFPPVLAETMAGALRGLNGFAGGEGHFQPSRTICLETVACRVTGRQVAAEACRAEDWQPLTLDRLAGEADALADLDRFRLQFVSPLRITRPAGAKTPGHRYADEPFFLDAGDAGETSPLSHFILQIRTPQPAPSDAKALCVAGGALTWLDVPYGRRAPKTLGGVVGTLHIDGRPAPALALHLVAGQYLGAGKNAAFGFGFFRIPELALAGRVAPLSRGQALLDQAASVEALRCARQSMPDAKPGPDGLSVNDLHKAGDDLLEKLHRELAGGCYQPGAVECFRSPKKSGGFREIVVANTTDRLVQRALADFLAPAAERILSSSSYAYRRGLNRQGAAAALRRALTQGCTHGFKADIETFFDSVDTGRLTDLLQGLFPCDPLTAAIGCWLEDMRGRIGPGLPQGSPLSPVLSNLYLDRFDREMAACGLRLVRYADDFVALFRPTQPPEEGLRVIEGALARIGLKLAPDKVDPVNGTQPVAFLGMIVDESGVEEKPSEEKAQETPWHNVLQDTWRNGHPVYLTSICRGAYSSGPDLVINLEKDGAEKIPWQRIGRIVVVGRSSFSGGIVYRAVREEIPVSFIDVMGRPRGNLLPELLDAPYLERVQQERTSDNAFVLSFARSSIAAKIHNTHVLLRRNGLPLPALKELARKTETTDDLETLRGLEGTAARLFFGELGGLVAPFTFTGRQYRPPDGPVNAMLSFGYTLLYNRIATVLRDKGFNPRIGVMHQGRGRHAALASDLMEELRHIVERLVLAVIHRKEIGPADFSETTRGGTTCCRLEGRGFRSFIRRFEHTMAARFTTLEGERMSYNAYLDEMADNLRRAMKLEIPYRALRIR